MPRKALLLQQELGLPLPHSSCGHTASVPPAVFMLSDKSIMRGAAGHGISLD
jgi:hypothetical protein